MPANRVVGLSSRARPEPLLKSLPRTDPLSARSSSARFDVPPEAPPLSDSESDDDGRTQRGDITSTAFTSGNASNTKPSASPALSDDADETEKPARPTTRPASFAKAGVSPERKRLSDGDDRPPSARVSKRLKIGNEKKAQNELGKHYEDSLESRWARSHSSVGAAKPHKFTYSKSKTFGGADKPRAGAGFEKPAQLPGKMDGSSPAVKKFSRPASLPKDQATPSPRKSLRQVQKIPPPKNSAKSTPRRRFKKVGAITPAAAGGPSQEEASQRMVFKMPENLESMNTPAVAREPSRNNGVMDLDGSMSPLTDLGTPPPEGDEEEEKEKGSVCPFCRAPVDAELLGKFASKTKRMDLKKQEEFCHLHRKKTAQATWDAKGYPQIDWRRLEARIARQYGLLKGIVEGSGSHYGDIFDERLKSGKAKTLASLYESEGGNPVPGYYGIRGLRVMSENLAKQFSSLMKERATQDKLISARGYTAFVQSVLVPELTVQLIMEDMGVAQDEARSILRESAAVGELLNDEVPDVLDDDSDAESLSSSLTELSDSETEFS